jgi:hypothetical protein
MNKDEFTTTKEAFETQFVDLVMFIAQSQRPRGVRHENN